MLKNLISYVAPWLMLALAACQSSPDPADMVLLNGNIYTMDSSQPKAEAIAVRGEEIIYVGSTEEVKSYIASPTEVIDLEGKTLTPGLIEGHAHFMGLGQFKRNLDLTQVKNYEELVKAVADAVAETPPGQWILGRGWHQSKWDPQPDLTVGYQTHEALSAVSPDNPVFLTHASGHASFVNAKAMEIAGLSLGSKFEGEEGEIIVYPDGRPTGVLTERASALVSQHIPENDPEQLYLDFRTATETCLENGITGFHDAGISQQTFDLYQKAVEEGEMDVRMYAMLSGSDPDLIARGYERGPLV
ncbi:MAG: amidohydrolase family protein, partial [Bacteroidota bacterium]